MFHPNRRGTAIPNATTERDQKSAECLLFGHYLRTGQRLDGADAKRFVERKFNPNHDPEDGRFTFGAGGGSLTGHGAATLPGRNTMRAGLPTSGHTTQTAPSRPNIPANRPVATTVSRMGAPRETEGSLPLRRGGAMNTNQVHAHAKHAMHQFIDNIRRRMSIDEAAAWAANSEAESGGDHRKQQPNGPGRGMFQWGSNVERMDRRRDFRRVTGVSIEDSTIEQQISFRDWELANSERGAKKRIDSAAGAGAKAHAIAIHYLRPSIREVRGIDRANIAEAIAREVRARIRARAAADRQRQARPRP
jgi:Phage tail lysozyme